MLAGKAAEGCQVPQSTVDLIQWTDARAWAIQSRLVAVGLAIVAKEPVKVTGGAAGLDNSQASICCTQEQTGNHEVEEHRSEEQCLPPAVPCKAQLLEAAAGVSRHNLTETATKFSCNVCATHVFKNTSQSNILQWLQTASCKAGEVWPPGMHTTHRHWCCRGVHCCTVCGAWGSTVFRKLSLPCEGKANSGGAAALRKLHKGCLPQGLHTWPSFIG
jgi:hypothetical protein